MNAQDIINEAEGLDEQERADSNLSKCSRVDKVKKNLKGGLKE